jgi:broad specificity phosphatase PhoE
VGVHTCDKRQTKTYIQAHYGNLFEIDPPFTEEDQLWQADHRETDQEVDSRTKKALDAIFNHDPPCTHDPRACAPKSWLTLSNPDVAIVSHSGTIESILRNLGHRPYSVLPGGRCPSIHSETVTMLTSGWVSGIIPVYVMAS